MFVSFCSCNVTFSMHSPLFFSACYSSFLYFLYPISYYGKHVWYTFLFLASSLCNCFWLSSLVSLCPLFVPYVSLICPLTYRAHSFPYYPHLHFLTLLLPWPILLLLPSNFISHPLPQPMFLLLPGCLSLPNPTLLTVFPLHSFLPSSNLIFVFHFFHSSSLHTVRTYPLLFCLSLPSIPSPI